MGSYADGKGIRYEMLRVCDRQKRIRIAVREQTMCVDDFSRSEHVTTCAADLFDVRAAAHGAARFSRE